MQAKYFYLVLFLATLVGSTVAIYSLLDFAFSKALYPQHGTRLLKRFAPKHQHEDIFLQPPFIDLLKLIGRYVYIQPYDEALLNTQLQRVGFDGYTARTYTAKSYCMLVIGGSITIAGAVLKSPIVIAAGIIFALFLFLYVKEEVGERLKKKRLAIDAEVPKFIQNITSGLEVDRDITAVIRRYRNEICGPALAFDLDVLLADFQIGNNALALLQFRDRINLPAISRLVSILINVELGYNQSDALKLLASDVNKMRLESRKRELALRPGKMKRAMIPAFLIAVFAILYVFVTNMLAEVSGMF